MPSSDDKFEGDQCRIKVNPSGGYFHLHRAGDISEINIADIANALSHQCRYTGHMLDHVEHYSVAQHCVLVSRILEQMGAGPKIIFEGLMHDATEAYLADMAAPFKHELGGYYAAEQLVQARISKRYNLPKALDPMVKKADWYALFIEARQLVNPDEEDLKMWAGYPEYGEESKKYHFDLEGWSSLRARIEFLTSFAQCCDRLFGTGGLNK